MFGEQPGADDGSYSDEGMSPEEVALRQKRREAKKLKNKKRRARKKLKKKLND